MDICICYAYNEYICNMPTSDRQTLYNNLEKRCIKKQALQKRQISRKQGPQTP